MRQKRKGWTDGWQPEDGQMTKVLVKVLVHDANCPGQRCRGECVGYEPRFVAGDKVRVTKNSSSSSVRGVAGIVLKNTCQIGWVRVRLDLPPGDPREWHFRETELEGG